MKNNIMTIKGKTVFIFFTCLILTLLPACRIKSYAEIRQRFLTNISEQQDLTVMFVFDTEVTDITFISPSGEAKKAGDSDVENASGELWSTYRIVNAAPGSWKIEYDLGNNTKIDYSIIKESGITITYFDVNCTDDKIELAFDADCSEIWNYNYEVSAISTTNSRSFKIISGWAKPGAGSSYDVTEKFGKIPSDSYILRLNAYFTEGTGEVFDSVDSETVNWINPGTNGKIEDFITKIYQDDSICSLDWTQYSPGTGYTFIITAKCDGETVYTGELERLNKEKLSFSINKGTKQLEISLGYYSNYESSEYTVKTFDLDEAYLHNSTENITGSATAKIDYEVKKETELYMSVNGAESISLVDGSSEKFFSLQEGVNEIYAELRLDDQLYYIIDDEIYADYIPPTISMYEDLDGKTISGDSIVLMGKVTGSNLFRISGNEVKPEEDGSFEYEVKLDYGENIIEIEAEDGNGNVSAQVLTLYRKSEAQKAGTGSFMPLIISLILSLIIAALAVVFIKKGKTITVNPDAVKSKALSVKNKAAENIKTVLIAWDTIVGIAGGLSLWQYITRYIKNTKLQFVETIEESAANAVELIRAEKTFGILALVFAIITVISVIITVYVIRKERHNDKA